MRTQRALVSSCGKLEQHRGISFNGHAWISSLRYGFPFGPQLGSFVHQYCSEKDLRSAPSNPPQSSTSTHAHAPCEILDDMRHDADMKHFSFDQSPCYAGPSWMDAKAAKLVMQRRHDAADALHCRRGGDDVSEPTNFQSTLTFDLLRQIREMYKVEMANAPQGKETDEGNHRSKYSGASAEPKTQRRATYGSASMGSNRATSALDEVFLDDAAIYTRALVYVSGGSRLARDWIAGCAALSTNHPSLITIAMQHQGSHEDLEDFARYCEIVAFADDKDCSLLPESRLCERRESVPGHRDVDISGTLVSYNASAACGKCDGDGVIIDLPVPLAPARQAAIIKRCLIYDAMSALHFMEFDAELLDLSRVRASATYLQVPSLLVEQLREVVIAEHSLVSEKHRTMDTPPANVDGAMRHGSHDH